MPVIATERRAVVVATTAATDAEEEDEAEGIRQRKQGAFKSAMQRCKLAKIDLHKTVLLLEHLRDESADKRWQAHIERALEFWETENEWGSIPGHDRPEEDGVVIGRNISTAEHRFNDDPDSGDNARETSSPFDDTPDYKRNGKVPFGGWHTIKPRGSSARQRLIKAGAIKVSTPSESASTEKRSANTYDVLRNLPDLDIVRELQDVLLSSPTPQYSSRSTSYKTSAPPSRKRKTSGTPPDRPQKRVRIAEEVEVLNTEPGTTSVNKITIQTHMSHTAAERARRRREFQRRSKYYKPQTWALESPNTNLNTSFNNTEWDTISVLQKNIKKEEMGVEMGECELCPDLCSSSVSHCRSCRRTLRRVVGPLHMKKVEKAKKDESWMSMLGMPKLNYLNDQDVELIERYFREAQAGTGRAQYEV
ncbi:hypothetical protein E8E13_007288 [Curvularia kusanoi]|uniref:Uncharacterized protein n=1 Tax=Curvularia kusanoi TaxID=90978 RepID=A0A9P4T909_CURKU|nr:hypothetical protein E8E13_007288 [Curvularia kusanoi]